MQLLGREEKPPTWARGMSRFRQSGHDNKCVLPIFTLDTLLDVDGALLQIKSHTQQVHDLFGAFMGKRGYNDTVAALM